ncbi:hypothetical protein Tco_1175139 [Tanacetum coccineum]
MWPTQVVPRGDPTRSRPNPLTVDMTRHQVRGKSWRRRLIIGWPIRGRHVAKAAVSGLDPMHLEDCSDEWLLMAGDGSEAMIGFLEGDVSARDWSKHVDTFSSTAVKNALNGKD